MKVPVLRVSAIITTLLTSQANAQQTLTAPVQFSLPDGVHISALNSQGDSYTAPDTVMVGGMTPNNDGRMIIRCQPYGFYDTEACFDI